MIWRYIKFSARQLVHVSGAPGAIALARRVWAKIWSPKFSRVGARCPACGEGVLCSLDENDGAQLWLGCSKCRFFQSLDPMNDAGSVQRLRNALRKRFGKPGTVRHGLALKELAKQSRFFYAFAGLLFLLSIYYVATSGSVWPCLNSLGISIYLATKGFATAYRYWQLKTYRVWERGAFHEWLHTGEWFV